MRSPLPYYIEKSMEGSSNPIHRLVYIYMCIKEWMCIVLVSNFFIKLPDVSSGLWSISKPDQIFSIDLGGIRRLLGASMVPQTHTRYLAGAGIRTLAADRPVLLALAISTLHERDDRTPVHRAWRDDRNVNPKP